MAGHITYHILGREKKKEKPSDTLKHKAALKFLLWEYKLGCSAATTNYAAYSFPYSVLTIFFNSFSFPFSPYTFIMGFLTVLYLSLAALSVTYAAQIMSAPKGAEVVPNSYIVVMKDDTSKQDFASHRVWVSGIHHNITRRGLDGEGVKQTYDFDNLRGYSGIFDKDTIKDISNDPKVYFPFISAVVSC